MLLWPLRLSKWWQNPEHVLHVWCYILFFFMKRMWQDPFFILMYNGTAFGRAFNAMYIQMKKWTTDTARACLTVKRTHWICSSESLCRDWDDGAAQYKVCFTLPLSPAVQSRSLRSVMEVYSIQPGYSVNRDVDVSSSPHGKLRLRPEYADMDPLHHNHSYRDGEHHHGDPITGHAATLRRITHHEKDRKWCHGLAHFVSDVWPRHRPLIPATDRKLLSDWHAKQPTTVCLACTWHLGAGLSE